jgi:predicted MFS family arabinose efflux permease
MVATMQLAIMAGAASGGVAMVHAGPTGAFGLALVLFIVTTVATALALRVRAAVTPAVHVQ